MKVKSGATSVKMPPFTDIRMVWYSAGRSKNRVSICQVPLRWLEQERRQRPGLRGVPTWYAFDSDTGTVELFPACAVDCQIRVRYTPAMKEC